MPIQTSVAPRQKIKLLICILVSLVLGLWGLYDYAVKIPRREREVARFAELSERFRYFEQEDAAGRLTTVDREEWARVRDEIDAFQGRVPQPPAKWDRPVQLWLYVVGCGIIGVPMFAWMLWSLARRRYRLDEDGTFHHPEGVWKLDEVQDIDMDRWMEKSIAVLRRRDGATVVLDDYKYKNMHRIVGFYAHRFHPEQWTEEARMVKRDEPSPAAGEPAVEAGAAPGGE